MPETFTVTLTADEIALLRAGLAAHRSDVLNVSVTHDDPHYRAEGRRQVAACRDLSLRLGAVLQGATS